MKKQDIPQSPADPIESLKASAAQWNPSDWKHHLPKLTPVEIKELVCLASKEFNQNKWKDLLGAGFHSLEDKASLEAFGSALNSSQFIEILSHAAIGRKHDLDKLTSLLVTLSPSVFKETLLLADSNALDLLKGEAFGEPLLYHLTFLVREVDNEIEQLAIDAVKFGSKLETLNLLTLDTKETHALDLTIGLMAQQTEKAIGILQNAQRLAWVADRADLIDDLSKTKEKALKTLQYIAGEEEGDTNASQTLRGILAGQVNTLFSDTDDNGNITYMHNEQPALDAIVKFSVWYLNDYEEIGLLPQGSVNQLDKASDEDSRQSIRKALFDKAGSTLAKAGLNTLFDLKKARLFSKGALKEYLSDYFQARSRI